MSTIEQELAAIKDLKREKEIARARTEAQAEAARDQVREATKLLMEMGCKTIEEARARMTQLEWAIQEEIEEIRKHL